MVRKLTIKESQDVEIEVQNKGVLEVPEGKSVDELPIKHFVAIADKKGLDTVTKALNNLQVWNKNKNKALSKWAGDMIDKVSKRFENRKDESYHAKHIHEIYSRNFINSCIADMEAKGLSYEGINNRGYLIFKDNKTNKSLLFSDWDDVNGYDGNSLSDFDIAESIDFDEITIPEDERYEYVKSKAVTDSDGFQTDYTMYYDWEDDKYVFIFGDSDIYTPANEYPDYECESEREANEWFADYEGFIDESCHRTVKESLRYYVTDDDYIPLKAQPENGYTQLKAIERAQREAEESAKLFGLSVSETAKWYHIMDSDYNIVSELDKAI